MILPGNYLTTQTGGWFTDGNVSGYLEAMTDGWWYTYGPFTIEDVAAGFTHSYSNIAGRSGISSHGIKPVYDIITFSIGIAAESDDSYITKDINNTMPKAMIKNGILKFDIPQTHPYFGVGDVVTLNDGNSNFDVVINNKLTCSIWLVHDGSGCIPDSYSVNLTVVKIDKSFHSIVSALSGVGNKLGTKNLISISSSLRICCYEMDDNSGSIAISTDWTLSKDNTITIYTPINIKTDCNKVQRHQGDSTSGYIMGGTIFITSNVHIQGLIFKKTGSGGSAINVALGGSATCNIITGAWDNGVLFSIETIEKAYISNNYFNGNTIGINCMITTSIQCHLYNNTFNNCDTSIEYKSLQLEIKNNLMKGGSTCLNDNAIGLSPVFNCITSDGTAGSDQGNLSEVVVEFLNTATDNLRVLFGFFDYVKTGIAVSLYNNIDIFGNLFDNTYCIGAYHEVQEIIYSIGSLDIDLLEGPATCTISLIGIITFSEDQLSEYLCPGCVVYIGINRYYLKRKIDNDIWEAINSEGNPISGDGVTEYTIDHIYFSHSDLFSAIDDLSVINPIADDVKIIINCSEGKSTKCIDIDFDTDITRFVTIQTPANRRHNGKWDENLFIHYGEDGGEKSIRIMCPYTIIDGLQIRGGQYGIYGEEIGFLIKNNITRDCKKNGITFDSNNGEDSNSIINNFVYDCNGIGIEFKENIGRSTTARFEDLIIETIDHTDKNSDYEVCFWPYFGGLLYPEIRWLPERVEIICNEGDPITLSQLIDTAKVYGEPWGVLSYLSDVKPTGFDKKISEADNFLIGNSGNKNNYLNIYNNTIFNCYQGIVIDSHPINRFYNRCSLKNNIVNKCISDAYINRSPKSPHITADCCIGDDDTLNKFIGYSNYFPYEIDIDITLYESLKTNSINLEADPNFSFNYDATGYDRLDRWNNGFLNYNPLRNGKMANFSLGNDDSNLNNTSLQITIKNGIATFIGSLMSSKIGIGDKVIFNATTVYLSEKGTDFIWLVLTAEGELPADVTTPQDITEIKRVFNSTSSINGSGVNDLETLLGFRNLALNETNVIIWFYKDDSEFEDSIYIINWITNSVYKLKLATPYNVFTECMVRQRHHGYYGGVVFNYKDTIQLDNSYIILEGFVLNKITNTSPAISIGNTYDNCLIKCNIIAGGNIGIDLKSGNTAISNIVYHQTISGIDLDESESYNNTCVDTGNYSYNSHDVNDEIINCIGSLASIENFHGVGQFINCVVEQFL